MGYILDTHVFLWFIEGDTKLHKGIIEKIEDIENPCFLSIASFWEIVIKKQLGKLETKLTLQEMFRFTEKNQI